MKKLKLPVTLVIVDTVNHDLARLAVEDSTRNIEFAEVIVFSDKKEAVPDSARWVSVNISTIYEYQAYLWYGLPFHISTPHYLVIQWDGFVINSQGWTDEFLNYDYIGAPWYYNSTVGNGGFSLRSLKLAKHVINNSGIYRLTSPEDEVLCCAYGKRLTKLGFNFADRFLASRFSFESVINRNVKDHFGFHAVHNFPHVLTEKQLNHRMSLFTEYSKSAYDYWQSMFEKTKGEVLAEGRQLGYMKHE